MKDKDDKCIYGTHNTQSPCPSVLEPGFYLRVSSPRREDNHVMAAPISDPSLLSWFGELILNTDNSEYAFWLLAITALESAPSKEEGYANFRVVQESVVNVDQGIPQTEAVMSPVQIKIEPDSDDTEGRAPSIEKDARVNSPPDTSNKVSDVLLNSWRLDTLRSTLRSMS